MANSENINIYEIYVNLILDDDERSKTLRKELGENNEGNFQECLFFGKKSKHLYPVTPFKWEGVYRLEKKDDKQVLCHSLLFDFIEVLVIKFPGVIKDNTLLKSINTETTLKRFPTIENINIADHRKIGEDLPFQLIDIEWKKWEDNYPSGIDGDTILSWLLTGTEKNKDKVSFGDKYAYKKLGLCRKDDRLNNLSTLSKCFLSCSSKRILIIRSKDVKENIITVPDLEIACGAAIGLVGASLLLDRLDDIEKELGELFKLTDEGKTPYEILEKTSKVLRDLGVVFRRASQIQRFYSGYPISSPITSLLMETFSRSTGSKGMIKALGEKLENAYRLYQLYQQYYYFKEMEKLESKQGIS